MSDARIMKFQTAKAFYDFCVKHDACEEGLAEISGLTLDEWEIRHPNGKAGYNPDGGLTIADWWDKTERADYMLWLERQYVWSFTQKQSGEFGRMTRRPSWAKFCRARALVWAEHARAIVPRWPEWYRAIDLAWAEYHCALANAIREILGNPFRKERQRD